MSVAKKLRAAPGKGEGWGSLCVWWTYRRPVSCHKTVENQNQAAEFEQVLKTQLTALVNDLNCGFNILYRFKFTQPTLCGLQQLLCSLFHLRLSLLIVQYTNVPPVLWVTGICWSLSQPSAAKEGLHPVQVANSPLDHIERETKSTPIHTQKHGHRQLRVLSSPGFRFSGCGAGKPVKPSGKDFQMWSYCVETSEKFWFKIMLHQNIPLSIREPGF